MAAYLALAHEIHRYPEGSAELLRQAIGQRHNLDPERIVCGAGSDELIGCCCAAYAGPGDEVLYSRHGFLMYPIGAQAVGATPVAAPERELTADVDARPGAGQRADPPRVHRQSEQPDRHLSAARAKWRGCMPGCRPNVVLAIDAAYAEFVNRNDYEAGHRAGRPGRERRHAAHLFKDLCAGRATPRLGLLPTGDRRCAEPHSRAVQCQRRRHWRPASRRSSDTEALARARAHNDHWQPWLSERLGGARPALDPKRRQFRPAALPRRPAP